jgi:RHS repeat-associated protein
LEKKPEENALFVFGHSRNRRSPTITKDQYVFVQKETDYESQLQYFDARFYISTLARFLTTDPLLQQVDNNSLLKPQDLNVYAYCNSDPVNYHDLTGLQETSVQQFVDMLNHKEARTRPENGVLSLGRMVWDNPYGRTAMERFYNNFMSQAEKRLMNSENGFVHRTYHWSSTRDLGRDLKAAGKETLEDWLSLSWDIARKTPVGKDWLDKAKHWEPVQKTQETLWEDRSFWGKTGIVVGGLALAGGSYYLYGSKGNEPPKFSMSFPLGLKQAHRGSEVASPGKFLN